MKDTKASKSEPSQRKLWFMPLPTDDITVPRVAISTPQGAQTSSVHGRLNKHKLPEYKTVD